jgi:hypothetical protein
MALPTAATRLPRAMESFAASRYSWALARKAIASAAVALTVEADGAQARPRLGGGEVISPRRG